MRRTRDNNWQFFLFLIPAIAAGFGIHYMMKKNKTTNVATNTPSSMTRTTVDAEEKPTNKFSRNLTDKVAEMTADQDAPQEDLAVEKHSRAPASVGDGEKKTSAVVAAKVSTNPQDKTAFELRGDGMSETHVSNEEWTQVMTLFHQSKADLQAWLITHNTELPGGLVKWMSEQVENAKLQRPPLAEEPDLNWRGIGVVARTDSGENAAPLLRVGGGFVKMSVTEPQRAHFELTRLIAQAWSPCDMPTGARATWQPLLKCMGLKEQDWDYTKSCAIGTQSEAGWAVASAVAAKVSPPGCVLPAFQNAAVFQCLGKTAWFETPVAKPEVKAAEAAPAPVVKPEVKAEETTPEVKAEAAPPATEEKAVAKFTGKPEAGGKEAAEKPAVPMVRTPASLPPNASSFGGKN
jgi:hypothetical protein